MRADAGAHAGTERRSQGRPDAAAEGEGPRGQQHWMDDSKISIEQWSFLLEFYEH
jgi:hypothetical protein